MKSIKRATIFSLPVFIFLLINAVVGQPGSGGLPPSSAYAIQSNFEEVVYVSRPDLSAVRQEDWKFPSPYRFGIIMPVDISPDKNGSWTTISDGREIWRATVSAPGAVALSAYFDRFLIPEGGKLFIYDAEKTKILGAYTSANSSPSGLFSTELIPGCEMTLEYVRPAGSGRFPIIHLNEITYAYRGTEFLYRNNDSPEFSGDCEVNIICPEGDDWQNQKKGITKIHVRRDGGAYWCTGSLVNNTNLDNEPYILTANHCGFNSTEKELKQWVFYFDYESSECEKSTFPPVKALVGATLKAKSGNQQTSGSDFFLVRLNQELPDTFHVYFNGWSRSEEPSSSGICIHHPGGDLKKISTYTKSLESTTWMGGNLHTHWRVVWSKTVSGHGVTEPGSSGSPLFDSQGRITGILSSGESACDSAHINLPDYYGKFYWGWSSDGTDSTRRLMYWLDPIGTNIFYLDGRYTTSVDTNLPTVQSIFPNPFKDNLTVTMKELRNSLVEVTVFDIPGRRMYETGLNVGENGSLQIDLGFLPSGLYILRLESDKTTISSKIVRQ